MPHSVDSTAANEQSKTIVLALKKAEELEKSLHENQAECAALQKQVLAIKERYEKEAENSNKLQSALDEAQRQRQQFERVIFFLRSRTEEAKLETLSLQENNETLSKQLANLQQENEKLQEESKHSAVNIDEHLKNWEDKYFELHQKWEAAESELKVLNTLEAKKQQMLLLLQNLTSLVESDQPCEHIQIKDVQKRVKF